MAIHGEFYKVEWKNQGKCGTIKDLKQCFVLYDGRCIQLLIHDIIKKEPITKGWSCDKKY